ncbi:MAG: FMN-binding protein, partial [Treponema sp.]|nr:FMN-binding protein [Treponema sp.]
QQRFRNGNFNATGVSYNAETRTPNGTIDVRVTFRGNRITQIVVNSYTDSSAFVNMVTSSMIPAMITAQTSAVDGVSGATHTGNGLRQAVAAAMDQARR